MANWVLSERISGLEDGEGELEEDDDDELDDDKDDELSSITLAASLSSIWANTLFQSDNSKHVDMSVPVTVPPTTTANTNPWRSMFNQSVIIAPMGTVTSTEQMVAMVVTRRYCPCAPTRAQHTMPIFIEIFPTDISGSSSVIMPWMVSSSVSNDGRTSLKHKNTTEINTQRIDAMNIDLYADSLALLGWPFPKL
jgi:hypothetical protein